jgi:hypothetical protein
MEIKITYYASNFIESLAKQLTFFGGIAFLYWFNKNYLGDSTVGYLTAFFFVCLLMGRYLFINNPKTLMFDDKEKAIEFLKGLKS